MVGVHVREHDSRDRTNAEGVQAARHCAWVRTGVYDDSSVRTAAQNEAVTLTDVARNENPVPHGPWPLRRDVRAGNGHSDRDSYDNSSTAPRRQQPTAGDDCRDACHGADDSGWPADRRSRHVRTGDRNDDQPPCGHIRHAHQACRERRTHRAANRCQRSDDGCDGDGRLHQHVGDHPNDAEVAGQRRYQGTTCELGR